MTIRKLLAGLILLAAIAAMAANFAFAATQTFTGVVTDDMCGKKHTMLPGKSDAECVRACIKAHANYALLVGDKVYVLKGDARQIDPLAAKKVKVSGEVTGNTIAVSSIALAN
jgi:hypothetical protein